MCVIEGMLDAARLQLILITPPARFPSGCKQTLENCFWDYSLGVWGKILGTSTAWEEPLASSLAPRTAH